MKPILMALAATSLAAPLMAQGKREMDAHVHGVSQALIAVEHGVVEINILSPGMDIVGFEYAASSDADKDAVEAAIRTLLIPENIVTLPEAAECRLGEVLSHMHGHDHEAGHGDDDDDHKEDHDGHDHEDHAEDADHDHDDDEGHDHEDHAEDDDHDHNKEAVHSEFHVRYIFACEHEEELTTIGFPFFDQFENAQEIEAQFVTETGVGQAEVSRAAAELSLN